MSDEIRKVILKQLDRMIKASNKADKERVKLWEKVMREESRLVKRNDETL